MASPTLLITDRLGFIWRLLGVNYVQMRTILDVKLRLDHRRPPVFSQGRKESESRSAYWVSLVVYTVFGAFFAFLIGNQSADRIVVPLTLFFSYVLIVCCMSLISDFSSVVLDSSDNQIILCRPVDSRTLLTARIVHISSYLFTITLSVGAIGILVVGYRFGSVAGLLMVILCLLTAVLSVFLTNVVYLLLMRFVSNERLREVINYVQIGMAIFFYGGYQLLPRLFDSEGLMGSSGPFVWQSWHFLIAPLWSAGSLDLVINRQADLDHLLLLGLALLVPVAGIYLMNRVLAPAFSRRLTNLDQDGQAESATPARRADPSVAPALSLAERLGGWLTTSPLERAGFTFVWFITGRDRKFKLRTYPGLGFGLAYAVAMSINTKSAMGQSSGFFLFILYFGGVYLLTAFLQLAISDNFKAAWIFESTPLNRPGPLLAGGLKALVIKLMIPYYGLLAAYVLYLKGTTALPDILLAFANSLVMLLVTALMSKRHVPFSMAQDVMRNNTTSRSFASLFVLSLVGAAHWGLTYLPYGRWIALPVMLVVAYVLFRSYCQTSWDQIEG